MELISTLGHLHGDLKVTLGLGDLQVGSASLDLVTADDTPFLA
jgi:hypothetical protein